MKIGIDGRQLVQKRTGVGNYVYEIIKEINSIDNDANEYVIYSNKQIFIDFKLKNNWRIVVDNHKVGTMWLYYKLPKLLKKDNIDVFWGNQHFLPKRNKYTKNIYFISTIHDIAIFKIGKVGSYYNTILQKILLKKSCNASNKIIAISESTKKDLIDIFNINQNKIEVVYNGYTPNIKNDLSEEIEKEINDKYLKGKDFIFFLSTIEPRKNIITLIEAFDLLKREYPDYKLILSGGLGWKYNKILHTIDVSPNKEDIIMTGYITKEEKKYFYKYAKCFAFPSLYEGFGLPILEALSEEQVVVCSNNSSLPEVGGDAVIYYNDTTNSYNLCAALKKAIELDDNAREKMVLLGHKQVEKFSWQKCALETYNILIGGDK